MEWFRRITIETKTGLTRFWVRGLWLSYNPTRYARKAPEFITIAKIGRDDNVHHCIVFYRLPTQAAQIWLPNIGRGDGRVFTRRKSTLCAAVDFGSLASKVWHWIKRTQKDKPCDVSVQCEGFGIQNLCLLFLICLIIAFLSSTPFPYGSLVTQEMLESWVQDVSTLHTLCLWDCRQRYVEKNASQTITNWGHREYIHWHRIPAS